jgi:hypothetical protein
VAHLAHQPTNTPHYPSMDGGIEQAVTTHHRLPHEGKLSNSQPPRPPPPLPTPPPSAAATSSSPARSTVTSSSPARSTATRLDLPPSGRPSASLSSSLHIHHHTARYGGKSWCRFLFPYPGPPDLDRPSRHRHTDASRTP